jgi:hypothetical protein
MIGGDAPYDHEAGGGPADDPPPQTPQFRQPPQPLEEPLEPSQPRPPLENEERAAPAQPGPPPGPVASAAAPGPAPAPPEPTGDERVDAALSRFDELATAPVADHVEIFEDVHRRLQDVLAAVDHDEQPETAAPEEPAAATPGPIPRPNPGPRPGPPRWGS